MKTTGLLATSALCSAVLLGFATPAMAQETPSTDEAGTALPQTEAAVDEDEAIVVTGSRIRRSPFNSPDPITIVDPGLAQAKGQFNTSEMIQSSVVAAGSAQVTSAISSAFVTNGGPGAETVSLRGLGAERTLVLLNGRRAGPAGTRGAISAFDLNVLPQSIVQSVEILKTGASSVYGSDAVAGVVNLITKKNTDGVELNAFSSVPGDGGGEQYRINATWGKDFGNGHVMVALDYNRRQALQRGDRSYLSCPEEYIFREDGSRADLTDPRTGKFRCNDTVWGHVWVYDYDFNQFGRWQYSYGNDNLGNYIPRNSPRVDGVGDFITPPGFYQVAYDTASTQVDNAFHPYQLRESLIPKTNRYTAYVDAAYEISDNIEIGTELLFNRRETYTTAFRQFWATFLTEQFLPEFGVGDPFSPGWGGAYFLSPTPITDHYDQSQKVDYFRGLLWADGNFGSKLPNWNWNGYVQFSRSDGDYTSDIIYQDSVDTQSFRTGSCVGTSTAFNGLPCIDIDWTNPRFLAGDFSPEERAFLFGSDTGNTVYKQISGELSASGPIFKLPAGEVQVAIGVSLRRDEINDVPGEQTLNGNSWGLTSAGITAGHTMTKEAFAEIEIPVIHDTPGIQSFTLSGSGRVTNVNAVRKSDGVSDKTNGNWTYSIGANWEVTDWLRFRGRYGTSFRAPALFEQFLSNQSSFVAQRTIDPCIGWAQALAEDRISQRIADNCAAGTGTLPGVPGDFSGGAVTATVFEGGGLGVLEPETSTAKSVSAILTPKLSFLPDTRINIAVDYFDIEIEGEIATLSAANIINGCYNSDFFPDDPLCSLFTRNAPGSAGEFGIGEVTATFININRQRSKGVDVTANIQQDLGRLGSLSFLAQMNWQIRDRVELFEGTSVDDTGEEGEPQWVGDFNIVYEPDKSWSFFYGVEVIGATSDEEDYIDRNGPICDDSTIRGFYCVDVNADAKFYHSASLTKKFKGFEFTLGVSNLFNTKPPRVTAGSVSQVVTTVGQSLFASQYDLLGRRFFVNAKASF